LEKQEKIKMPRRGIVAGLAGYTPCSGGALKHSDQIILPYAVGHFLQFRDHQDFGADASDESLIDVSIPAREGKLSPRIPQGHAGGT
jgi:hypothetical protein